MHSFFVAHRAPILTTMLAAEALAVVACGGETGPALDASTSSTGGDSGTGVATTSAGSGGAGGAAASSTSVSAASSATTSSAASGGGPDAFPWTYEAALDQGIRDDANGLGHFRAPRTHGPHTGVDALMPTGTKLRAACDGKYLKGFDSGYGTWVQVVCRVPEPLAGGATFYASILYAHLDSSSVATTGSDPGKAKPIGRGDAVGKSGKSGNASGSGIRAHLHYEVAIHGTEKAALSESHAGGGDDATNTAAEAFKKRLRQACLVPTGFGPKNDAPIAYGRRIDPFVVFTCLANDKPKLEKPSGDFHPWSESYEATAFDVDVGQP